MFRSYLPLPLPVLPSILTPFAGEILSISFPEEGQATARNIISRANHHPTGKYPSVKMRKMLAWESPHERNAFRILDTDPTVIAFYPQPLVIHYVLDGETHWHTPDILVITHETQQLWEVKTARFAIEPDTLRRTRFLEQALPNEGYKYQVAIGEELGAEPRLSNVRTLLRHGKKPVSAVTREVVRRMFQAETSIFWKDLLALPNGRSVACRLILEGQILLNFHQDLRPETPLFWHSSAARKGVE